MTEGHFPLAFFDPAEIPAGELARLRLPEYVARVDGSTDRLLERTDRFVRMTRWTIGFAAGFAVLVLIAGLSTLRKNAELDVMKSEFVARASHELKTPLASIRLAAETLSEDRYDSARTVRSYGRLLLAETARLDRLVGQLLTFSQLTESKNEFANEQVDLGAAVAEALDRLGPQLAERGVRVQVTPPDRAPAVRGDPEALSQAFGNVIENSMKYAGTTPDIEITIVPRRCSGTHRNKIVSRERLLRTVWEYSEVPATRTVDFFIARLRAKLEKDPRRPQYLHTIYGKGYRLRGGDS